MKTRMSTRTPARYWALVALAIGTTAAAQEFPTRPVRLIVPTSPGTGPDVMARAVAPDMSRTLGQPVVVENRPGADSVIAYQYVAKQMPADGYTVAVVNVSNLAILPLVTKNLPFDALRDLPPLIGLAEGRWVFGSSSTLPWNSFGDLVTYLRAHPDKANYGSSAPTTRMQTEILLQELKLSATRIDYAAAANYFIGLVRGDVQMGLIAEGAATTLGDKFRVLAVTGRTRSATFPAAPTFAELGFPQMLGISYSLNVPANLPRGVFDRLYAAARKALQHPDVKSQAATLKVEITADAPAVAAKKLADEYRLYADVAKKAGIQP